MNPVVLLALGGVALMVASRKKGNGAGNGNGNGNGNGAAGANPASVFCVEQGGAIEIREDAQGNQYGICVFPDGREVEEWDFFRGDAQPEFPPGNGGNGGNGGSGEPGGIYVPPVEIGIPLSQPGYATPGTFYQVTSADLESARNPIEDIAAMAIFENPATTSEYVREYVRCINSSAWNLYYYGVEDEVSQLAVDGFVTEGALQTVNYDALGALNAGLWPQTAVVTGTELGMGAMQASPSERDFFGLLWLPPARVVAKPPPQEGSISHLECPEGEWGDGISRLLPPPAILNSLGGPRPPWWAAPDPGGQQA